MTTPSNFASSSPLLPPEDLRRVAAMTLLLLALGVGLSTAFILLRLVLAAPSAPDGSRPAPAAQHGAAGVAFQGRP